MIKISVLCIAFLLSLSSCCWFNPHVIKKCSNGDVVRIPCKPEKSYKTYESEYDFMLKGLKAEIPKIPTPVSVAEVTLDKKVTLFHEKLDQESIRHNTTLKTLVIQMTNQPCNKDNTKLLADYLNKIQETKIELAKISAELKNPKKVIAAPREGVGVNLTLSRGVSGYAGNSAFREPYYVKSPNYNKFINNANAAINKMANYRSGL